MLFRSLIENSEEAIDPSEPISVETDVLEPMGDQIFVYLKSIAQATDSGMGDVEERSGLLMSVDPDSDIGEDESAEIIIDRGRLHLFDMSTGAALSHGVVREAAKTTEGGEDSAQVD